MKPFDTIGDEELKAVSKAIILGPLSGYIGSEEHGGHYCDTLEQEWSKAFHVKHSVAVNSATSGLLAACMAVGVSPGDEVIVSPYTMSATAAAPKVLGAKVVFADIETETFTIDPGAAAHAITSRTKAIIATNLFGHPAHLHELLDICSGHGIHLIEDNAQSIFANEYGAYTGTIGHIGVFSLNVHKHLQVGEGGICCTNNTELAAKLREAMNHGEMRGGIAGLNLRMTEVTAAMARVQLAKGLDIVAGRRELAHKITTEMAMENLPPFALSQIRQGCESSYYCLAGLLKREPKGHIPEPFKRGYLKPLNQLPAFRDGMRYPVTEDVDGKIVLCEICSIDPTDAEITQMVRELGSVL